jgi:CHASE3 domain sensor protein
MSNTGTSRISHGAIVAFALSCLVLAVLTMGTLWQAAVHHNLIGDAQTHDQTAAAFQTAENEGKTAGTLLQQYVATGDATLIPQIQSHTANGGQQLTVAIQALGSDPGGFTDKASQMVTASGQVTALRQSGDTAGAASLLSDLDPQFQQFVAAQDAVIASEQKAAADARSSADNAETATIGLAIIAGVLGAGIVVGGLVVVSRGSRRRAVGASA